MSIQLLQQSLLALVLLVSSTSAQYGGPAGFPAGSPGGTSHAQSHSETPSYYHHVVIAHGVLASLSWVIFFPLGAILMRTLSGPKAFRIHFGLQAFTILIFTAAVGMGIWMARLTHRISNYHIIIGLVIFAVISVQVTAALIHHYYLYPKVKRRTSLARVHLWLGRILITLGMINGGLGLKISAGDGKYGAKVASRAEIIAYGVVSGIMLLAYAMVVTYYETRSSKPAEVHPRDKRWSDPYSTRDSDSTEMYGSNVNNVGVEHGQWNQGSHEQSGWRGQPHYQTQQDWYQASEQPPPPHRSTSNRYTITSRV